MRLTLLFSLVPALLAAQLPDSSAEALPIPISDSALRIPVDGLGELISWLPGGALDPDGAPAWRGQPEQLLGRSVDGILWSSLVRNFPFGRGVRPPTTRLGVNAAGGAELLTGSPDASVGQGLIGFLRLTSKGGGERWTARGLAESGAPLNASGGTGTSLFELALGGALTPSWRLHAAATVLGRESAPTGLDYGTTPFYRPGGIDTTYTFESFPGSGDSVSVDQIRFASGDQVPNSPRTTTDAALRVDGRVGRAALWVRYLRGTEAERSFNYVDVMNTAQSFGRDGRIQDLAAGTTLALPGGWRISAAMAWQEERSQAGPIDGAAEAGSRSPTLGLLTDGALLRFTLENFPVDEELEWNYRLNTPGSRRSPYDLENTDQYRLTDQWRNNAYALLGFSESGGPIGRLQLYQDRRTSFQGSASHTAGSGTLTVGAELRYHDIQSYSHQLTSQALSDVWRATPVEQALFASWRVGGGGWSVTAGARLDRFDTHARRPRLFPRLSSVGDYVDPVSGDTLRWARGSLDRETWYELNTDPDEPHTIFSPRIAAEGGVAPGFRVHASAGRLARTPDLGTQLAGLNTDYAITNPGQGYGSDYGHEVVDVIEAGGTLATGPFRFDLTIFRDRNTRIPVGRLESRFDPLSMGMRDVAEFQLVDGGGITGATLTADWSPDPRFALRGSYTETSTDDAPVLTDFIRPSSFILTARGALPGGGHFGGLAALLTWRQASGLSRVVLPGSVPLITGQVIDRDIPAWRSLDLRVVKGFDLGGRRVEAYLDARNLLNAENLLRAFAGADPRRDLGGEALRWSSDSSSYAREALTNGVYNSGVIDLTFSGAGRGGCGPWVAASGQTAQPNCGYLIAAEERFGDGDGSFTLAEQQAASLAFYRTQLGRSSLTAPGRSVRLGAAVKF